MASASERGSVVVRGAAVRAVLEPIRQTLLALMQVLPQGLPFLQSFWAAAGGADAQRERDGFTSHSALRGVNRGAKHR